MGLFTILGIILARISFYSSLHRFNSSICTKVASLTLRQGLNDWKYFMLYQVMFMQPKESNAFQKLGNSVSSIYIDWHFP